MKYKVTEIPDENKWTAFLEKNNPWAFFQDFAWGQVQKKLGTKLWRYGVFDGEKVLAIFQVALVSAKRGSFLHVRHGPVLAHLEKEQERQILESITEHLKILAKQEGVWFVRINPMLEDTPDNQQLLKNLGFAPSPIHALDGEYCWVLNLDEPTETLLANMRKTTRYLVRQAEKMEVVIEESDNIDAFIALYKETAKRQGFVSHRGIREEFEVYKSQNRATLVLGKHNDQILAGALIVYFGNQAIYHHGASLNSKVPASYLVQWHAIQAAQKRGCKIYNFWGIAPPDSPKHPWLGLSLFKQGFGGYPLSFLHTHDYSISPLYKLTYMVEVLRKKQKGY